MDKTKFTVTNYSRFFSMPSHILVGSPIETTSYTKNILKHVACINKGCNTCIACKQIDSQQHATSVWISPEKSYTIDTLNTLFTMSSYSLEDGATYFFILQKAETLNIASANKLLKILEEPPRGYHFILHTNKLESIPATIISRCSIEQLSISSSIAQHALTTLIIKTPLENPSQFLKILETNKPSEHESILILDQILYTLKMQYQNRLIAQQNVASISQTIDIIKQAMTYQLMPGSSALFWKNLYLQLLVNAK